MITNKQGMISPPIDNQIEKKDGRWIWMEDSQTYTHTHTHTHTNKHTHTHIHTQNITHTHTHTRWRGRNILLFALSKSYIGTLRSTL